MWQTHRIACITYHKFPKGEWPTLKFAEIETMLPNGESGPAETGRARHVDRQPEERTVGTGDPQTDHQRAPGEPDQHGIRWVGVAGFCCSCSVDGLREAFRYMMEHFAIDALNEYRTERNPETKRPVVNPRWRELDRQKRSVKSKLTHRQARFAELTLHPESDESRG